MCNVSVIIPCYNVENKISKCLDSLSHQTVRNFEVIFVDDCSTDNTVDKINRFRIDSDLDIKLLKLESNSGPGIARNEGIKIAAGEYLCFCDSDDRYAYDFIEKMYNSCSQGCDLVICNMILEKNGHCISNRSRSIKPSDIPELLAYNDGSLCNIMFHRSLFNDLKLPSIYHGEDMAIVPLLISKANKFDYIDESLYYYQVNNDSLSNTASKKTCDELLESFKFLKDNINAEFYDELEFCGIKNVLYGYTLNAFKARLAIKQIKQVIKDFEINYPKWYRNQYIKVLGLAKRLYLMCVRFNFLFLVRLYSKTHEFLLKRSKIKGNAKNS